MSVAAAGTTVAGGLLDVPEVRAAGEVVVPSPVHGTILAVRRVPDQRAARLARQWRAALAGPVKPDWESIQRGQAGAHSSMRKRRED